MLKHLDCNQFHQKLRQIQVLWSNNKNLFFTIDCVRALLKLQLLLFVIRFYVGFGIFLRFLLCESGMQLAGEGAGLQGKSPALLWKLKKVSWFFWGEGGEISLCLSIYGLNCSFKTMLRACSKKKRVGIVPANNV